MKRNIAILLVCMLTVCAMAGCGASQKTDTASGVSEAETVSADSTPADNTSKNETTSAEDSSSQGQESSVKETNDTSQNSRQDNSKTENSSSTANSSTLPLADSSEDGGAIISIDSEVSGVSVDEDGNIVVDPDIVIGDNSDKTDENSEEPTGDDGAEFLDLSYQMTYLSPEGFTNASDLPKSYYITSAAALQDFIQQYSKAYSLDVDYTDNSYIEKMSFVSKVKDLNDGYFENNDALIVITAYDKKDDCDLGNVSIKGQEASVEIWAQRPASAADTGYVCIMVNMEKDVLKDKNITTFVNPDSFAEDGEEA